MTDGGADSHSSAEQATGPPDQEGCTMRGMNFWMALSSSGSMRGCEGRWRVANVWSAFDKRAINVELLSGNLDNFACFTLKKVDANYCKIFTLLLVNKYFWRSTYSNIIISPLSNTLHFPVRLCRCFIEFTFETAVVPALLRLWITYGTEHTVDVRNIELRHDDDTHTSLGAHAAQCDVPLTLRVNTEKKVNVCWRKNEVFQGHGQSFLRKMLGIRYGLVGIRFLSF